MNFIGKRVIIVEGTKNGKLLIALRKEPNQSEGRDLHKDRHVPIPRKLRRIVRKTHMKKMNFIA